MPKSLAQLQAQIAKLHQKASAVRAKEVEGVVSRIKEAITAYGLTPADLFGTRQVKQLKTNGRRKPTSKTARSSSLAGRKVAIKYKDASGNTWTGRGNKPRWLTAALANGKKLESFAV